MVPVRLGTIALLRTVTYGKRFESVGILLHTWLSNRPNSHAKTQGNCWISLHLDEVGRVQMFQRRRERKGDFGGYLVPEWAHLVHMFWVRRNAKKIGNYTTETAPCGGGR